MAILVLSAKDYQCFYEISNVRVGKVIWFFFLLKKIALPCFVNFQVHSSLPKRILQMLTCNNGENQK